MLIAKTNTNAIIVFDAPIFDELLHRSFSQQVVKVLITQVVEHDETLVVTLRRVVETFFKNLKINFNFYKIFK